MSEEKKAQQGEWRVARTQVENDDVTSLFLEGPMEQMKDRKPGQFAAIKVWDGKEWSEPHPFTITCAPGDDTLRFTIKKVGEFTSKIRSLKPGTPVHCAGPFGVFCKDVDQNKEIVMIAGGVGVTPFLSVLRHFRKTKADNRVVLFWANRTPADAFASEELEAMTRELNLKVVHTFDHIESEDPPPSPNPERVVSLAGYLNRDILRKYAHTLEASFYLCGPPPMQDAVLAELEACGVDPSGVQKETFTWAGRAKKG
jgi:predicted ferric reductase